MTLKELSQLYYLNREIEMDQRRLEKLRAKSTSPGSPRFDEIPKGTAVISKVECYAEEIVDLEAIIAAKQQQCIHERNRLERYINDIEDSLTRQIFQLRFVNGLTWSQISFSVGGGNTEESVRKRVYRYLKRAGK